MDATLAEFRQGNHDFTDNVALVLVDRPIADPHWAGSLVTWQ